MILINKPKQYLYILFDALAVNAAFFLALYFRYDAGVISRMGNYYWISSIILTACFLLPFIHFKFYSSIWFHAGFEEYFKGSFANIIGGAAFALTQLFFRQFSPAEVILGTVFSVLITLGARIAFRNFIKTRQIMQKKKEQNLERVMIVGAGEGASYAIREIQNNLRSQSRVICAVDDDMNKIGKIIAGIPVVGNCSDIPKYAEKEKIETILIAIPSLSLLRKKEILDLCKKTGCRIKTMPGIYEIVADKTPLNHIRDIDAEELLGKSSLKIDLSSIEARCKGKTILVTGAAGMIGSEISGMIPPFEPRTLILLDINEVKLLELHNELTSRYPELNIKSIIQSVKDRKGIDSLFNLYKPDGILHCAFFNHEVFLEESPSELIKNNVFGTLNLVQAAHDHKAQLFMMVSVDKAVNPTHLMSASKRICEMIVQSMNQKSDTRFCSVRFGNISDNAYSYIARFKEAIELGDPILLPHRDLTRYTMTVQEAAYLILQAGCMAVGGEIFVLDMGRPVLIYNLAADLIRLSGLDPEKDIPIQITGNIADTEIKQDVRIDEAGYNETSHERIYTSRSVFDNYIELKEKLDHLRMIMENGNDELISYEVVQTVQKLVPNFHYLTYEEAMPEGTDWQIQEATGGKRSKKIFLSSPHMGGLENMYIREAFDTNWVAPLGPNVDEFENELSRYVDIKSAAAMVTGTSAIHMALRMLGVKRDDLVFCSSLTFSGSCNPIIYESAVPVFIDADPGTWTMSPAALQKAFHDCEKTGRFPKAVIVVNLYGQSADYDALKAICDPYGVPIVEDAAESLGSRYKNHHTGTAGKFGVFSLHDDKFYTGHYRAKTA